MEPSTPAPARLCPLVGPLATSMVSTRGQPVGAPSPLRVTLSRMPLKNMSGYWPRLRDTFGWPTAASE